TATTCLYTLALHDALPILTADTVVHARHAGGVVLAGERALGAAQAADVKLLRGELLAPGVERFFDLVHCGSGKHQHPMENASIRSEEHTSELQSRENLVCR